MIIFEPRSNCQYNLLLSVRKWQNHFQQGVSLQNFDLKALYLEDGDVVKSLNANCKLEHNLSVKYKLHTQEWLVYYYRCVQNL